jgi:excisionase family DNA binding protein
MAPEDTLTHVNLDALYATPGDDLSEIVTLDEAARRAGVTRRTLNRWINAGHLQVLPGGRHVINRDARQCKRDRYLAGRQGRPGARVRLDTLT